MEKTKSIEIWGGIECTVNRIGDIYYDQLERNKHATYIEDLDLFSQLNIKTVRYPALWEKIAPDGLEKANWGWIEARLEKLNALGIEPIIGLLHHGSGPAYTNLLDPLFAEKFVKYAKAFAERFPHVKMYTPINEPLTTARFSCLYGYWYPHAKDDVSFTRALINQCRAIVLAMKEIKSINSAAILIQTEDLGKTYSTPSLAYQAEFDNNRRWLSFDLLMGKVNKNHPLFGYLEYSGINKSQIKLFENEYYSPDIIGINHYITSERFLDHEIQNYPLHTHGGNGKDQYADIEAVRVLKEGAHGPKNLFKETWERYKMPIAITEVHLGGRPEQQIRWVSKILKSANELKSEGINIKAITAWAFFGAYEWNNLLTQVSGYYESGVYDLRAKKPRPTILAKMFEALARNNVYDHPLLDSPGWWEKNERITYKPKTLLLKGQSNSNVGSNEYKKKPRTIIITGASGTLGKILSRKCEERGIVHNLLSRAEMDITNPISVKQAITRYNPWAIINAAGYVNVELAEKEVELCKLINTKGVEILAQECAKRNIQFSTFSTDLVFDGTYQKPYTESNHPKPLNVYGQSKFEAEKIALKTLPHSLIIRTSAFFDPLYESGFITSSLNEIAKGNTINVLDDVTISPTYVPDLADATLDLLIDGSQGIWHLSNNGTITWADFIRTIAGNLKLNLDKIHDVKLEEIELAARRPKYSALTSERARIMPTLQDAINRYLRDSGR